MKEKIFALLCALSLLAGCAAAEHTKEASSDSVPETEASDDSEAFDDPQTAGDSAAFRELFEIKAEGIDYLDVSGIRIPEGINISLVGKDASSGYWKQVHAGAQQAADDINAALGYTGDAKAELIYDASETGDVAEQIDIIDQMLDKNPDALIIGFVDVNSGKTQLELAEQDAAYCQSLRAQMNAARDTASRARVGYSTIRSRSSPLGPTPSWAWKSTGRMRSSRLKRRDRPHTSTTGHSSPLERWMDRMDTPSPSWAEEAAENFPPAERMRSRRRRNWNRERQPLSSSSPARAYRESRLSCRSCPPGMAPNRPSRLVFS